MSSDNITALEAQRDAKLQELSTLLAEPSIPLTDAERAQQARKEREAALERASQEAERLDAQLAREREAAEQTAVYEAAVASLQDAQAGLAEALEKAMQAAAECRELRSVFRGGAFKLATRSESVPAKYWTVSRRNRFRESALFAADV